MGGRLGSHTSVARCLSHRQGLHADLYCWALRGVHVCLPFHSAVLVLSCFARCAADTTHAESRLRRGGGALWDGSAFTSQCVQVDEDDLKLLAKKLQRREKCAPRPEPQNRQKAVAGSAGAARCSKSAAPGEDSWSDEDTEDSSEFKELSD